MKAAETYIRNLEAARDKSEEGTFYIAGGRIQKRLRFTNWQAVEEEPKYALRDLFESSAFHSWFKDSKVVDEEGNPLQV